MNFYIHTHLLLLFMTIHNSVDFTFFLLYAVFARDWSWPGKVRSSCCDRHLRPTPALRARAAHCGADGRMGTSVRPSDDLHRLAGHAQHCSPRRTDRFGLWTELWGQQVTGRRRNGQGVLTLTLISIIHADCADRKQKKNDKLDQNYLGTLNPKIVSTAFSSRNNSKPFLVQQLNKSSILNTNTPHAR